MGYVYVIDFGEKIKVGYSINPSKRIQAVEYSCGMKKKNQFIIDAPSGFDNEWMAHQWIPNRLEGEFFAYPFPDAVEIVKKIVSGEITKTPEQIKSIEKKKQRHIERIKREEVDSTRKANNKWDAANMTVLGCKIRKDKAEAFKAACKAADTTPNAVFTAAINRFMNGKVVEGGENNE